MSANEERCVDLLLPFPLEDTCKEEVIHDQDEHVGVNILADVPPASSPPNGPSQAQPKDVILFFLASAGSTIGWTSVLSNLVYYTDTLGVDSFFFLNIAVYSPLLPIFLAQALYDSHFDRVYQSQRSYFFRGSISFLITLVAVGLAPLASQNLTWLSIISLFLGTASAVLHGTLKQMASFVYPNCGRLPASVASGMQVSAAFVLIVALLTGFGHCGDSSKLQIFYFSIAGIVGICWAAFQSLMLSSPNVDRSMLRRDSYIGGIGEPLLSTTETGTVDDATASGDVSYFELWNATWQVCVTIMITVGSSMAVASWFNRVKSQDPMNQSLPQVLFYTRIFADLLGRPATLYFPMKSIRFIGFVAILRLSFVPVFFVYCSGGKIPKNDVLFIAGVACFAFSSGYLSTSCYQLAPSQLPDVQVVRNSSKQAGLINICFATSVLLGLLLSVSVKPDAELS